MECKTYIDSIGVALDHVTNPDSDHRIRLFAHDDFRRVLVPQAVEQLTAEGKIAPGYTLELWLVAGRLDDRTADDMRHLFDQPRDTPWKLIEPREIAGWLRELSSAGSEDDLLTFAMKLAFRDELPPAA